jgi:hypothetical protein
VGRRVQHLAVRNHARRIAEPNGVPVGFNFSRCGPTRTRTAIESLERGGVEK